ncbi:polar amino acid transport system substrate-binding protein [Neorhizobium galegae]|uniref:transporter substrate-binding domain-containing protein n=1 Tax=Neorhizobium galegae TaxID=399 RepID=UPI0027877878|nr:transporter substrate-binding domain-containing protein [Neorhizobium galegae]MDQ0133827.1 polar amino acid transport system substrate-binding protein [Neorhizobium galegae]
MSHEKITRFRWMRSLAGAGMLLLGTASMISAASLPEKYQSKAVRVGLQNQYAPFNYIDPKTKELTGLSVDLFAALEKKMGVKMEVVIATFPDLFPGLQAGRFDLIGAGIADNAKRRETLTFADYLRSGYVMMTTSDKTSSVKSWDDLCGKSVAYIRFVALLGDVLKGINEKTCVAKAKTPITIVTDDLPVQLGLSQNRYEAAMIAQELYLYLQSTQAGSYAQIGDVVNASLFGIAFQKPDTELRDAIGAGIQSLIDDGTYGKLLDKYGLKAMSLEKVTFDAGQN